MRHTHSEQSESPNLPGVSPTEATPTPWSDERPKPLASRWPVGKIVRQAVGMAFGAAIGAGVMYLLDPEKGHDRRKRLGEAANDAIDRAGGMVGSTVHEVSHRAAQAGSSLASRGSSLIASAAHALPHRLATRHHMDRPVEQDDFDRRHGHGISRTKIALAGVGALALGAGAMWLFDARLGRGRRAWIRQKTTHAVHSTGDLVRSTGRHLRNKAKGYTHRAGTAARNLSSHLPGHAPQSGEEGTAEHTPPAGRAGEAISYGLESKTPATH